MGEKRNTYRLLVGKTEGKCSYSRWHANSFSCFKPRILSGKVPVYLTFPACHHPQQLVGKVTQNMEGKGHHIIPNILAFVRGLWENH
jgi:hypothetical protein